MKKYEALKIEVAMFDVTDVICTSGGGPETTEGGAIILPPMDIEDE